MIDAVRSLVGRRRWRALVRSADDARDRGDLALAAHRYREVTRAFPNRVGAWVQLGNMSKDRRDFAAADEAYRIAVRLKPGDADIHLQIGHLRKLQGHLEDAVASYRQAALLDPASAAADELKALGQSVREGYDRQGSDPLSLDLPPRGIIAHRQLTTAFEWRRV